MAKETSITATILKHLRQIPMSKWEKRHGGKFGNGGRFDITGSINGVRVEIEVKTPVGVTSKLQEKEGGEWVAVGVLSMVVCSWDEVKTVLDANKKLFDGAKILLEMHPPIHGRLKQ